MSSDKRISYIAKALNYSKSSISEEIKQVWYKGKYVPSIAYDRSLAARKKSHEHTKWRNTDLQHFILTYLKEKWSPEIIAHEWNKQHPDFTVSHTFIYDLIENHRREWIKYLIYKGRHRRKLTHSAGREYIKNRIDISLQPKIVNKRERFGDFEVDTVIFAFRIKPVHTSQSPPQSGDFDTKEASTSDTIILYHFYKEPLKTPNPRVL